MVILSVVLPAARSLDMQQQELQCVHMGCIMKRSDDIDKSSQNGEIVAVILPFSKTANIASRIIKKHFKLLKDQHNYDVLNIILFRPILSIKTFPIN
jgi:hypothetical protein